MKQIYIVPTYKCNNRCLMCGVFNSKKDSVWEYSLEEIKQELENEGISKEDIVIVSGGEPTIYKHFFDLLKYLEEKEARVIIFSNGRMFKNIDFVEKIKTCKYENILIPLFGSNSQIHDQFTGIEGSFRETCKGLHNLEEAGVKYSIKTVAMKNNYKDLREWAQFVSQNFKNPIQVSIHGLHLQGEAGKIASDLYISHQEEAAYIESALDILIESGLDVFISAFPLCTLDPYYWKYNVVCDLGDSAAISNDSQDITDTNNRNYNSKPSKCEGCKVQRICEWPWKMYDKLFKLDYLSKV